MTMEVKMTERSRNIGRKLPSDCPVTRRVIKNVPMGKKGIHERMSNNYI